MKWKITMKRWLAAALSCAILAAEPGFLAVAASDDTLPERPAASAADIAPDEPDVEPYAITTQPYAAVIEAAETTAAEWEHLASTTAAADAVQSIAAATTGASEAAVPEMTRKRYDSPSLSSDAAAAAMATYPTEGITDRATTTTTTTTETTPVYDNITIVARNVVVDAGETIEYPLYMQCQNLPQSGYLKVDVTMDSGIKFNKFIPETFSSIYSRDKYSLNVSIDLSKIPSSGIVSCGTLDITVPYDAKAGNVYVIKLSANCRTVDGSITVDVKKAFDRYVDGNSFAHNNESIYDGFYGITNYHFRDPKYITALCNRFRCSENEVNYYCEDKWGGSCHGIAYTIALQYNHQIDVRKLSHNNAVCYYEMEKPWKNNEFLDTINYYQIKYNLTSSDTVIVHHKNDNWLNGGESLSKTLQTIVQKVADKTYRDTYVLSYGYHKLNEKGERVTSGHAIVAIDVKYKSSTNQYEMTLYDENGKMVIMSISSDYKKFGLHDYNGHLVGNLTSDYEYTYIKLTKPDVLNLPNDANYNKTYYAAPSASSAITNAAETNTKQLALKFPMDAKFILTNKEGKYLRYQGDDSEATMSLSGYRIMDNSEECAAYVEVPYSESFTLVNLDSEIGMTIINDKTLLSLDDAKVSSATFDLVNNNIHINKAKGDFTVYLPPTEEDGSLVRFSGNASGTVDVSASAGEIQLSGDSITDATAKAITSEQTQRYYMHDGNKLTATFSNEGELISDMLSPFGDVNCDHELNVVDVVSLQKWLLNAPNAKLPNWVVADLCEDGEIDAYDLALLKQRLITETTQSDWVLASKVPAGANITATKYTYDLMKLEETTFFSPTMAGWTLSSSAWKKTGSGTHAYANYPSGFDTGNAYYKKYEKSALKASESTSAKREVSAAKVKSYIYWHWNYLLGTPGPLNNRYVNDHECGEYVPDGNYYTFCHFSAFESTTNLTDQNGDVFKYDTGNYDDVSWWWFKLPVYEQTYTDYKKEYHFIRTTVEKTGLESKTDPTGQLNVSNVQKWVRYLKK